MERLLNIIAYPSLFVHETLHIIITLIVGATWNGVKIKTNDNYLNNFDISVEVYTYSKYKFQNTLIHIAPILALFITPIIFLFNIELAVIISIYQLLTINTILPSKGDIDSINNYKTNEELILEIYE